MLKLNGLIQIGNYSFEAIADLNIDSSYDTLTDTCEISLPRRLRFQDKPVTLGDDGRIKKGDSVVVYVGYNQLYERFKGRVSDIEPNIPVKITCEDEMWTLKQNKINFAAKKTTLVEMLDQICPVTYTTNGYDIDLYKVRFDKVSFAAILKKLRDEFGVYAYFRNEILNIGLPFNLNTQVKHNFIIGRNVVSIDNLQYQRKEDVNIKVTGILIKSDNTKIEVSVPDGDGDYTERTLHFYDSEIAGKTDTDREENLKKILSEKINEFNFSGYRGSFKAKGLPVVNHGDIVDLEDPENKDRHGQYIVKSVTIDQSKSDGINQDIELDRKV